MLSDERRWERYLQKVEKTESGCWLWQGWKSTTGYGVLRMGYGQVKAHRAFYEHFVGPIPDGMYILHSCDTPACVNPEHLRPGTQSDNMQDAASRGRLAGPTAENAAKEACHLGHPLVQQKGRRRCYVCANEKARARYAARQKSGPQPSTEHGCQAPE